ncbi:MAG: MBL fold metallo-hydrolase [Clostridiales bacterium]|nr:MBL fold metallo-hydrolase [Clostridiales bacterium]
MQLYTLASGSSGNSTLCIQGSTCLLVDAGISCRKITTRLAQIGRSPEMLNGILVTHTHSDHISGLNVLLKNRPIPVYATRAAGQELLRRVPSLPPERLYILEPGEEADVGELTVRPFATPHDSPGSVGYRLSGGGRRAAVVTDLGWLAPEVLEALDGVDLALVEANHDVDWLRSGPYPPALQARVLGDYGHLSNEMGGALAVRLARSGTGTLILAHLSKENNTPEKARSVVSAMLEQAGCSHTRLYVAHRDELDGPFEA